MRSPPTTSTARTSRSSCRVVSSAVRTSSTASICHLGYGKSIGKNMNLEVFLDLYNIYNRQGQAGIDDNYRAAVAGCRAGVARRRAEREPGVRWHVRGPDVVKAIDRSGIETNDRLARTRTSATRRAATVRRMRESVCA